MLMDLYGFVCLTRIDVDKKCQFRLFYWPQVNIVLADDFSMVFLCKEEQIVCFFKWLCVSAKDAMAAYKKGDAAGFGDRIGSVGASQNCLSCHVQMVIVCSSNQKEVQFGKGSHTAKLLQDGQRIENHGFEIVSEIHLAEII